MSELRFLTAGESHGPALVGVIEGIPSQLSVSKEDIEIELKRRKMGYGRGSRQKIETDEVQILSGVRLGKTLGSPVALMIPNRDFVHWQGIMNVEAIEGADPDNRPKAVFIPRPGHADFIGHHKYKHKDLRNVLERASARETAIRVALGAVAKKFLSELSIVVVSRVVSIGEVEDPINENQIGDYSTLNERVDSSPVRVLTASAAEKMCARIEMAIKTGDTLGGIIEVVAVGAPLGLGSYIQWDHRLEGRLAQGLMSLNAIKSVEIGLGRKCAELSGRDVHDAFVPDEKLGAKHESNRTGGIIGGMTTGDPIILRAAMKPIATLMRPLNSVDLKTGLSVPAHVERSDYCAVPAAGVIGEAIVALELTRAILEKFGGDSMQEIKQRVLWNNQNP